MTRLFRVVWVNCKNLDKLYVGPILYLTKRDGSPEKLRPYTEREAHEVVNRYNRLYKARGFHEVEELERRENYDRI